MSDRYTKIVLTIIAACMVWNVFSGIAGHQAQAQQLTHVIIDAWGKVSADRPLPVKVVPY